MPEVAFSGVANGTDLQGTLFQGKKFWLSQKVPQRSRFIEDVKANGGEVLPLEKYADIKIVDHARKESLPGTYSYTYIENSIRNGILEDLGNHAVGPPAGTVRSVGSIVQPAKATRTKFTQEDDRELWLWVESTPQKSGGTEGNAIYKEFEKKNPRHTWQSWRDRWVKHLKGTQRPDFVPKNAPPTPPLDQPSTDEANTLPRKSPQQQVSKPFSGEETKALLSNGEDIMNIDPVSVDDAWAAWASKFEDHSAQEWQNFWESSVRPLYLEIKERQIEQDAKSTAYTLRDEAELGQERSRSPIRTAADMRPVKRSPIDQPESPNTHNTNNPAAAEDIPVSISEASEAGSPPLGLPQNPNVSIPKFDLQSPKCKRAFFDEEEFPSSSPPETSKRQRYPTLQDHPVEIASTPEKSPALISAQPPLGNEQDVRWDLDDVTTPESFKKEEEDDEDDDDYEDPHTQFGRPPSQSLSSPGRALATTHTQAVFQDPAQYINFDLSDPEEGWSSSSIDNVAEDSDISTVTVKKIEDPTQLDTQALLSNPTQHPTFSIPDPDGGWKSLPSSPPVQPSQFPEPRSPTPSPSEITASLDAWIDSRITLGHPSEHVQTALECTCMDAELADTVLEDLKAGRGVPGDIRGVWTEEDDADLEAVDARVLERLELKHGGERVGVRWEWLRCLRGEGQGECILQV